MKIVSEQWVNTIYGMCMAESGYHINPTLFVVRLRREGMRPKVVQAETIDEVLARIAELEWRDTAEQLVSLRAFVDLMNDKRRPQDFDQAGHEFVGSHIHESDWRVKHLASLTVVGVGDKSLSGENVVLLSGPSSTYSFNTPWAPKLGASVIISFEYQTESE